MRSWTDRARWAVAHLCWNDGDPDPRVLQTSYAAVLLMILGLRSSGSGEVPLASWPVLGVALTAAGSVLVLAVPSAARRPGVTRGLAVMNIAVLGMLADGGDYGTASPLVVLPALWLGLAMGISGGVLAVGATTAFLTVPGLIDHGAGPVSLERLLILPVVAGIGSLAITAGVTAARAAQARAEAREAELVEALQVIESSRRSSQAIFEAVDVGLALLDGHGAPLLVNHRLEEFGRIAYPPGDDPDGWVWDETGGVRLTLDEVPTARARRGEEFDDVRVWIGEEESARRAMSVSARRIEDAHGSMVGAAVSYTDITDLMRAMKVKDEFIALVSHELRTPLTSIVGYTSVALERDDLDPLLRRHVEIVARNGRRLERLVDDLLDQVQQRAAAVQLEVRPTDLAGIVRECVLAAQPQADQAGVELTIETPETVPYAGDARRLAQVVDNLVSNAIKYTPAGGRAAVEVRVERGALMIRVRDTGIGIRREEHHHLFTRFFRTREATDRAIQGVGLGLSIAKSIVESHGGHVEFDSEAGRGSEFRVVLPHRMTRLAS